jgi:hypothetical protein
MNYFSSFLRGKPTSSNQETRHITTDDLFFFDTTETSIVESSSPSPAAAAFDMMSNTAMISLPVATHDKFQSGKHPIFNSFESSSVESSCSSSPIPLTDMNNVINTSGSVMVSQSNLSSDSTLNFDPTKADNMDVFFASGNFARNRRGNIALSKICREFQSDYNNALKAQQKQDRSTEAVYKTTVMKKIITKFTTENPNSKIWSRKNEGGQWMDITDNTQLIISKLQWKLCRKKGEKVLTSDHEELDRLPNDYELQPDNLNIVSNNHRNKRRKFGPDRGNDSVIYTLSRVIADLQRQSDSQLQQIVSLQNEIRLLKSEHFRHVESNMDKSNNTAPTVEGVDISIYQSHVDPSVTTVRDTSYDADSPIRFVSVDPQVASKGDHISLESTKSVEGTDTSDNGNDSASSQCCDG